MRVVFYGDGAAKGFGIGAIVLGAAVLVGTGAAIGHYAPKAYRKLKPKVKRAWKNMTN